MKTLNISLTTYNLVLAQAIGDMADTGRRLPGGRVEVDVDDDVYLACKLIDEDPDVAIARVCSGHLGHA